MPDSTKETLMRDVWGGHKTQGVYLIETCISYRRALYRRASLTGMYLTGMRPIGVHLIAFQFSF